MVFLESALEFKLNPLTALGRSGTLGLSNFVNKFNADAELLDDLVCFTSNNMESATDGLGRMTTGLRRHTRFGNTVSCSFNLQGYFTERAQLVYSADASDCEDETFAHFVSFW